MILISLTQVDNKKKNSEAKGNRKCSLERKGSLDSLCYNPGCTGREAITVNEISTVREVSCSAPWTSPSQLPACEREGLQVSAPGTQLLTKAAAVVIPGAQGPSQQSNRSATVFYVVVALES